MLSLVDPEARPPCSDPSVLQLVDEAFAKPGGPAGKRMRSTLCSGCPFWHECLNRAMETHQWGVWGGTSPHARTRHGAPGIPSTNQKRRARAS